MDRACVGGATRVIAAVATVVVTFGGMPAPAHATEDPQPSVSGAVAVPVDLTAAEELAGSLAQQAGVDLSAASDSEIVPDVSVAAPVPPEPAVTVPTGQYQPEEPQYHEQEGQYQQPPTAGGGTVPPSAPDPSPPADQPEPAAAAPVNVNVSVRVLSPGDDGAVSQSSSATPQPVSAVPNDGPPITPSSSASPVAVSVTVNVAVNWNIIWYSLDSATRYQPQNKQYQIPFQIEQLISSSIGSSTSPAAAAAAEPDAQAGAVPAPTDDWAADATLRQAGRTAPPQIVRRPQGGRRHRAAGHADAEGAAASWLAVSAASPTAAWARAPQPVRRATPRGDDPRPAAGFRPRRQPPAPRPFMPEPFVSAASSGAGAFATFFKTLAVLVSALGLAALRPARRIRLPSRRLQEAYGPRPEKPG